MNKLLAVLCFIFSIIGFIGFAVGIFTKESHFIELMLLLILGNILNMSKD